MPWLFGSSKVKRERDSAISQAATSSFTALLWKTRYEELIKEYNELVRRVNEKGGEQFLEHGSIHPQGIQISKDDLKVLIQLCHPDKHGGKESAVEITKKLLLLRE